MGRRVFKKVEENGATSLQQRYLYRSYLQIAALDLTRSTLNDLWLITWESPRGLGGGLDKPAGFAPQGRAANGAAASQPTEPIATRPLAIQKDGTWYTYGLDLTKNVMEVFSVSGYIASNYTYFPFGNNMANENSNQHIQFSSEFYDNETHLTYYNHRYYNSINAAWSSRDSASNIESNLYLYAVNRPIDMYDRLGLFGIWGAILGGIGDYVMQVSINLATGNDNPFTDVSLTSIGVSAAMGAVGFTAFANGHKAYKSIKRAQQASKRYAKTQKIDKTKKLTRHNKKIAKKKECIKNEATETKKYIFIYTGGALAAIAIKHIMLKSIREIMKNIRRSNDCPCENSYMKLNIDVTVMENASPDLTQNTLVPSPESLAQT